MALIAHGKEFFKKLTMRIIFAHLNLFKNDPFFFGNLCLGKGRIFYCVKEEAKALFKRFRRHNYVIDRVVIRGKSVYTASQ